MKILVNIKFLNQKSILSSFQESKKNVKFTFNNTELPLKLSVITENIAVEINVQITT